MREAFLSHFTPSLMSPEALEAIFVQREGLAARLVELIRDGALTPAKHHTLLVGPRGIGKTHLVSLVYHRIAKQDDLRGRLRIAWLREEEWGVTSLLDLLLRIFRALKAEYPDEVPAQRIEALYNLTPDAAEHEAGELLHEIVGDRTLLLLMENLDDLFQGLGDGGQKRLRAYLQDHPFCTILATSQSLFNGVSLQTSPFYGFFRVMHLQELDLADAVSLLTKIAELRDDRTLASFIPTPTGRARIRAIQELAGGHPRIYVIFSQFLTRDSLDGLVTPFMNMLDDLTPYYQARVTWLSPQQRKIVEFLCDRRHAVPVKEIAQRCFLTPQTASSQLKDLRDKGYVRSHALGRDSYYEIREPLMRLCIEVKKNRGEPIRLFVDFLRLWYSRDELQQRFAMLQPDAIMEKMYVSHALQTIEEESEDPRVTACLRAYEKYRDEHNNAGALQVAEELVAIRGNASDWLRRGTLLLLDLQNEALRCADKAIELDPDDERGWYLRGLTLGLLMNQDEALASFVRATQLNPKSGRAWEGVGAVLYSLGRYGEAIKAFEKTVHLGYRTVPGVFIHSCTLIYLDRWEEGYAKLEDALRGLAHTEKPYTGHTSTQAILQNLFTKTSGAAVQGSRIRALVELYDKHQVLGALAQGVVKSIPDVIAPTMNDTAAQQWRDAWRELVKDHAELQLPVRLLDTAVRWRENRDRRILLELPVEERKILEEVLKVEPS